MCVEIKMDCRVTLHHTAAVLQSSVRIQNAQCIGQHHALYRHPLERIHQVKHVLGRALHAVAPVLKIDIHLHTAAHSVLNGAADIADMLIGRLAQLRGHVLEAALAEQVHHVASCPQNPIG